VETFPIAVTDMIQSYNGQAHKNKPKIPADGACFYRALGALLSGGSTRSIDNAFVLRLVEYNIALRKEGEGQDWHKRAPPLWVSKKKPKQLFNAARLVAANSMKTTLVQRIAVKGNQGTDVFPPILHGWGGTEDWCFMLEALVLRDGQVFQRPLLIVTPPDGGNRDILSKEWMVWCMIITVPVREESTSEGSESSEYKAMAWYHDGVNKDHEFRLGTALRVAAANMPRALPCIQRYVGDHYEVNQVTAERCDAWERLAQLVSNPSMVESLPKPRWEHTYTRLASVF
jgi:hypothetical protein